MGWYYYGGGSNVCLCQLWLVQADHVSECIRFSARTCRQRRGSYVTAWSTRDAAGLCADTVWVCVWCSLGGGAVLCIDAAILVAIQRHFAANGSVRTWFSTVWQQWTGTAWLGGWALLIKYCACVTNLTDLDLILLFVISLAEFLENLIEFVWGKSEGKVVLLKK